MLSTRVSLLFVKVCRQQISLRSLSTARLRDPAHLQATASVRMLLGRALSSTSSRKRIVSEAAQPFARQPPSAPIAFQPIVLQHNDRPGILRMLSAGASAQLVFWLWCAAARILLVFL
jgi:hypothetical protein